MKRGLGVVWVFASGLLASACWAPQSWTAAERHAAPQQNMALAPSTKPKPKPAGYAIAVVKIAATQAEDGRGKQVPAVDPRALDLTGPSFPVRALDPVLHIGPLRFHHYTFPAKGVLRYTVADVALLSAGAEVFVQWGNDVRSRIVITRALAVSK